MNNADNLLIHRMPLAAGVEIVALAAIFAFCLLLQITMDCGIVTTTFCALSLAVTILPMLLLGRDIYTVICLIFGLRYVGVALLAKTVYGQSLEENLADAPTAYALTLLTLTLYVFSILLGRRLDKGRIPHLFSPLPPKRLHLLGQVLIVLGALSNLIMGLSGSTTTDVASTGGVVVISSALSTLLSFGIAAEVIYAAIVSGGRTFITPTLILASIVIFVLSAFTNAREFFATCVITMFVAAFLYGAIRRRHIVIGVFIVAMFFLYLSPVFLYVRIHREGLEKSELLALTMDTMVRAASDEDFYDRIVALQSAIGLREDGGVAEYDYYGNNNNVLNRLSYVALMDHVYAGVSKHPALGGSVLQETFERILPGFLFKKRSKTYGLGDYLGWETGVEETTGRSFINFGLPMEGLATWGVLGFLLYPVIFPLTLLTIFRFFSSVRVKSVMSIGLFASIQHLIVESTSDILLVYITRTLPIIIITVSAVYFLLREKTQAPRKELHATTI